MPFNGSGSFSPPGADFPAVASTLIESTKFNNVINDIATGLSTCITKDGQTTVTANIPFGGNKLTGVGAGTAATDAARMSQLQNGAGATLGTIAGTNTITAVGSPVITAYAADQCFRFVPANTNTGAATINIDGLGAKNIFAGGVACQGGELKANQPCTIFYDGTQFNLLAVPSRFTSSAQTITAAGALTIAHGLGAIPTLIQVRIKCTTGEHGYSTGDEVLVPGTQQAAGGDFDRGLSIVPDATNLNVRFGSGGNTIPVNNKTTGNGVGITTANWQIYFRAWVL